MPPDSPAAGHPGGRTARCALRRPQEFEVFPGQSLRWDRCACIRCTTSPLLPVARVPDLPLLGTRFCAPAPNRRSESEPRRSRRFLHPLLLWVKSRWSLLLSPVSDTPVASFILSSDFAGTTRVLFEPPRVVGLPSLKAHGDTSPHDIRYLCATPAPAPKSTRRRIPGPHLQEAHSPAWLPSPPEVLVGLPRT
jgi:hypothetical protein